MSTGVTAGPLALDKKKSPDGEFIRQESVFRRQVSWEPGSELPVQTGRYHLYASLACPWSHRTVIVRKLKGLQDVVGISYAAPFRAARGWSFTGERFEDGPGGDYVDRANGWDYLSAAYLATEAGYSGRVSMPVLWDTHTGTMVNNESADIMRMFNASDSLGALGVRNADLYPPELRDEIDAINARVYRTVNNGVYRAGFASRQEAYDRAVAEVFDSLRWLEDMLSRRRYLAGDGVTEADWRLFPTLVRFDEVYHLHFRCNHRRIVEYPHLWAYARELYAWPGVAETIAMDQIKRHYYTTHDQLNPKHIIPVGPAPDWSEPHGRVAL